MFNGDSGYGSNGTTVTGAEKYSAPTLITWFLPVTVWNRR